MASSKHLQFKSLKKPNHHARVLEVFVGTYNAKRKKVTQKAKKRKRLHQTIAQQTIQTTLQSPIVTLANAILEIYHHSCSQMLGIEPAWKLPTFFEVNGQFTNGFRRIIIQINPQITITKLRMRHICENFLK